MVVWLASYPRSGNALCRISLNHYFGIPSRTIYGSGVVSTKDLMFGGLSPRKPALEDEASDVALFKTHELPSDEYPAIYLVRHGLDSLYSYAHFILDHEAANPAYAQHDIISLVKQLINDTGHYGGWLGHVNAWKSREAPTAIVRYEDLLEESSRIETLMRALRSIGVECEPVKLNKPFPDFQELQTYSKKLFRRGQVAQSRELPSDVKVMFWEKHGDVMRDLGYQDEVEG